MFKFSYSTNIVLGRFNIATRGTQRHRHPKITGVVEIFPRYCVEGIVESIDMNLAIRYFRYSEGFERSTTEPAVLNVCGISNFQRRSFYPGVEGQGRGSAVTSFLLIENVLLPRVRSN